MLTQLFDRKKWIAKNFCRQRRNSAWVNEIYFFLAECVFFTTMLSQQRWITNNEKQTTLEKMYKRQEKQMKTALILWE